MTTPEESEKRKEAIVMIMVFARQLENWCDHLVQMKYVDKEFKYRVTISQNAVRSLLNFMKRPISRDEEDDFFELSAQVSDTIGKFLELKDQAELTEVLQLVESKLEKQVA